MTIDVEVSTLDFDELDATGHWAGRPTGLPDSARLRLFGGFLGPTTPRHLRGRDVAGPAALQGVGLEAEGMVARGIPQQVGRLLIEVLRDDERTTMHDVLDLLAEKKFEGIVEASASEAPKSLAGLQSADSASRKSRPSSTHGST